LERLTVAVETDRVTYRSDKPDGPTAGAERVDPLEFLARLVTHIPNPGQVMQRYYGWYASRTRGTRRRRVPEPSGAEASGVIVDPVDGSLRAARSRWAALLRRIFEVDPLTCPRCLGPMRILTVIADPAVITRILAHRARVSRRWWPAGPRRPGRHARGPHRPRATSTSRVGTRVDAPRSVPVPSGGERKFLFL